jgi:NADH-quinone oxidoreductase subunit L
MFMALGVGAFTAGIFHLMTHAFFKALLFLGAGSVIHALHEEQDMRKMGGLAGRLPWTHATMLVATIAIAGIPPLAGFFSKDEILHGAFASGNYGIWLVGILGAVLTAFYMFRLYFLTFQGPTRMTAEVQARVHESPRMMTLPLAVLAVLAVVGGWIGPPMIEGGNAFHRWLEPVFSTHIVKGENPEELPALASGGVAAVFVQHDDQAADVQAAPGEDHASADGHGGGHEVPRNTEIGLIVLSVLAGMIGIFFAWRFYLKQPELATQLRERWSALHKLLLNKYWVDELYDATIVRPIHGLSQVLWKVFDTKVVDGAVNGVGYTFEGISAVMRLFQTGFVGTYAFFFALGVAALLLHFLR